MSDSLHFFTLFLTDYLEKYQTKSFENEYPTSCNFQILYHQSTLQIIQSKFNVDISVFYRAFKTGPYFQLKLNTPTGLVSNVVYKISCLLDADVSYTDMTSRHLVTRAQ